MDDIFRWYNIACAISIALVGTPQLRWIFSLGGQEQLHWQSTILLNLTALWGTIESLRAGYPAGLRVYLLSMALTWLLVAVCYEPWDRWQEHRKRAQGGRIPPVTSREDLR